MAQNITSRVTTMTGNVIFMALYRLHTLSD